MSFLVNQMHIFPTFNCSQSKKPLVHHMTLFECSTSSYPGSDPVSWDIWVKSSGDVCNSNLLTPRDWDACITPVAVWAISSTGKSIYVTNIIFNIHFVTFSQNVEAPQNMLRWFALGVE